jgi:tRNA threonylcarbamoyladenosine biosynthesis protein TsaE
MKRTFKTSLDGIPDLAKKIASGTKGGEIYALIGDLGAGKTTFTKAFTKLLGVTSPVTSPTFVIMNRYEAKKKKLFIYHLDLYRTESLTEIQALGIEELWGQKDSVTIIEWADKMEGHLPKNTTYIYFA